jgi:hypothetical protein
MVMLLLTPVPNGKANALWPKTLSGRSEWNLLSKELLPSLVEHPNACMIKEVQLENDEQ